MLSIPKLQFCRLIKEIKECSINCLKKQEGENKLAMAEKVPAEDSNSEIIVDDDPPKKADAVNGKPAVDGESVVVIDEDSDTKAAKKPEVENIEVVEPEPVPETSDTVSKTSPLEEILVWLHDKLPLSEAELKGLCICMADFERALKTVQPSAKREGFVTVPDVTWDDVGSLADIREELQMSIVVNCSKYFWSPKIYCNEIYFRHLLGTRRNLSPWVLTFLQEYYYVDHLDVVKHCLLRLLQMRQASISYLSRGLNSSTW